ncbi:MAG: CHAT domain-containing protein [Bacteroidota bacterium]
MIRPRWGWVGALVVALGVLGPSSPPQEAECRAAFVAFRDGPWETRRDSPEARRLLLDRLGVLTEQYATSAPRCYGRLVEYQSTLLVLDQRHSEADRLLDAYLTGPGRSADASLRLRLLVDRGYVLERMGEIRASSQQYFAAAALAGEADAPFGVRALLNAAVSADILENPVAQARYLDEATQLLADSLRGSEDYDEHLGNVLMRQADILEDQIEQIRPDADRRAVAEELRDVSQRVLDLLSETGATNASETEARSTGYRARMMGANALALAHLGEHARAREVAAPMLELARQAVTHLPSTTYDVWLYKSLIAEVEGDLSSARQHALEARREAIALGNGFSERFMMRRLGHLAEMEGDWTEAAAVYDEAIAQEESYRERLGLQDWTAQAFAGVDEAYRGLVRTHLATGSPEAAFLALDRTRARYLRDLRRHLDVRARMTPEDRARATRLQAELDTTRLMLMQSGDRGPTRATVAVRVSELQEELEALTGSSMAPPPDLELSDLQTALGLRSQVLVSYFLDARGSVAFVVRPDTFVTVPLGTTPAAVEALLREVGTPWQAGGRTDPAFRLGALHDLYLEVMAPVMPWISGSETVVVVPDRSLGGVPFGMLVTEPAEEYHTAPYLVRSFAMTTELAASMIPEAADRPPLRSLPVDLLAFGRTDFESRGFTWNTDGPLADLPYVDDEVRQIGRRIEAREVALNRQATESNLMRSLSEARVIHLASHAESDPELPLYSKIALWEGDDDDGILYLYELQSRSLAADLVVLSGCSTARGRHLDGEGMVGLQYAVRTAGARASLATLWPVDDRASVELMGAFYDGLRNGLTKDVALQRAQVAYLDAHDGLSASPFFWAGPVLSGDTAPVPLRMADAPPWWLAAVLGLASLAVAWRLRRRRLDA